MLNLTPGLVSINFRKLSPEEVIGLVRRAGLTAIEWGGDIHCPHGDEEAARRVGEATRAVGLTVAAYGSYYRLGHSEQDGPDFGRVLRSARALGAPVIRVWAGTHSSAEADPSYRDWVVREARRVASLAGECGIRVALEFHANTLTDTAASAAAFLEAAAHPNLRSLWQPGNAWTPTECLASLRRIGPWLEYLHVFHRDDANRRRPLEEDTAEWSAYLREAATLRPGALALMEFVAPDDPEAFLQDATTLRGWLMN